MTLVISIAQQKGGCGKSTLAANLAAYWAASRRVALLDIDPQASATRWHGLRAGGPAIAFSSISGWRLAGEIERLRAGADVLIVDTPPQIDADAARAIRAASLVLIPVQPSMPDWWAAEATIAIAARERRPVALVLNRSAAKSRLKSTIEAAVARQGLTLLPTILGNRTAYAQAFAQGMGVTEALPRSLAAAEIASLAQDIETTAR